MPVTHMQDADRERIAGILGTEALKRLHAAVEEGNALPNIACTSEEWLELERRRLMWPMWMLAGFESRIPEAGDALPVRLAGCPIVLVRRHDGSVAAFTCPYHGWAYGLDGRIRTRPNFHGGGHHDAVPHRCADLVAVRCESWRGMFFVNIEGNARPLAAHMAPLDTSDPMRFIAPHLAITWHVIARPQEGRGKGLPGFRNLPDILHREGRFFTMVPTCNINVWPDHIAVLVAEPEGPGVARESIHILFDPDAMAGHYEEARAKVLETWDGLNREDDMAPLELMQAGRVFHGFDGDSFSSFSDRATQMMAHAEVLA